MYSLKGLRNQIRLAREWYNWKAHGKYILQAYCFSTEAWLFGGFLARTDLAHFYIVVLPDFLAYYFPRFHVQKDILIVS